MEVISINPTHPRPDRLARAVEFLRRGEVAVLPTETFYGLAVDCANAEALRAVNRLKQKPEDAPILLLMSEPEQVSEVADSVPSRFDELVRRFWPGPLTLVIRASERLPREVSGGAGTVAVRVPGLAFPRRLARELGRPISGVSANRHGEPPCRTAAEVAKTFPEGVSVVLDGGTTPGGRPSTIVDLTGERPRMIRAGLLPRASLSSFLPDLEPA